MPRRAEHVSGAENGAERSGERAWEKNDGAERSAERAELAAHSPLRAFAVILRSAHLHSAPKTSAFWSHPHTTGKK